MNTLNGLTIQPLKLESVQSVKAYNHLELNTLTLHFTEIFVLDAKTLESLSINRS